MVPAGQVEEIPPESLLDVSTGSAAHAGIGSGSVERHSHNASGDAPILQAADNRGGNIVTLPAGQSWDAEELVRPPRQG